MAVDLYRSFTSAWRGGVAVVIAALLLNALTLLPATHNHGPLHSGQDCSVCQLQATGVWSPSQAPAIPAPQAVVWSYAQAPETFHTLWTAPGTPTRGPPGCA